MPQAQVIDLGRDESKEKGIMGFLNEIGSRYKENKDKKTFENILGEYQQNMQDEQAFEKAYVDTMRSDMAPSALLKAFDDLDKMQDALKKNQDRFNSKLNAATKAYGDVEKKQKAEAESYELLIANGVPEDKAKELSKVISPANAKGYGKTEKGSEDLFEKEVKKAAAKEIAPLEKEIAAYPDIESNLNEVQDYMEKYLKGPAGYAKALIGTEAATHVETLSATNLDKVIKLFNPAGTLPTAKLNWIKGAFAVSPKDTISGAKGKIATAKLIAKQGVDRAKKRLALLKQYKGLIPEDVAKEFDDETSGILDALQDEYAPEEKKEKELPKGKVRVRNKQTGETGTVTLKPGWEKKYERLD